MKQMVLGGVLGGIVVFVWGMVSWMFLPFHHQSFQKFQNETMVQEVLVANAPKAGVYVLPNLPEKEKNFSSSTFSFLMKKTHEKMEKGPSALVSMRPKGCGPMGISMLRGLGIQILGAFFVTWLLLQTNIKNYFSKVIFVTIFALAAGIVCHLPQWNWWGFSTPFTLLEIADLLIGWTLAGFVIAKVAE